MWRQIPIPLHDVEISQHAPVRSAVDMTKKKPAKMADM